MRTTVFPLILLLSLVTTGCKSRVAILLYLPQEASHVTLRDDHHHPFETTFIYEGSGLRHYKAHAMRPVVPTHVRFMIPRSELGCGLWSQLHMTIDGEACSLLLSETPPAVTAQPGHELLTCDYTIQEVGW
jgi:hypothetical protein